MKLATTFLFFLTVSFNLFAKPASIEWKELIEYSDLIAFIEVKSIHRVDLANGFTEAFIAKSLKGSANSGQIKIHWLLSTDSTPIADILSDYIVFLRLRDDGTYEPSVSSKSVWRLETVNFFDKSRNYIDLELSLNMIESMPEELYSLVQVESCNSYAGPYEVKRVRLENILKYFNEKKYLSL